VLTIPISESHQKIVRSPMVPCFWKSGQKIMKFYQIFSVNFHQLSTVSGFLEAGLRRLESTYGVYVYRLWGLEEMRQVDETYSADYHFEDLRRKGDDVQLVRWHDRQVFARKPDRWQPFDIVEAMAWR